jgi:hypothetical protein
MYIQTKIIKNIYFQYFITGSKVISVQLYTVIAITLRFILRYCITLYHSIAKLSFLNVIALGTLESLSRLKVIALSKFEPLSLLKVTALRIWHKRLRVTPLHFEVTLPTSEYDPCKDSSPVAPQPPHSFSRGSQGVRRDCEQVLGGGQDASYFQYT